MSDDRFETTLRDVLAELYPEPDEVRVRPDTERRPRRAVQGAVGAASAACVVALAAAVLAARDAGPGDAGDPGATGSPQVTRAAPTSTAPTTLPRPVVADSRLTAPFSLGEGEEQLQPPSASDAPRIDAAAALAVLPRGAAGPGALVFLARLTTYDRSTTVDPATGDMVPSDHDRLVWVVLTPDVESAPVGAVPGPGAPAPSSQFYIEDDVVMVDARTGRLASGLITTVPDDPASTAPLRPDSGGTTS